MGKNVILTLILVFLIVANVSDAAILGNFRKLVSTEEHTNATVILFLSLICSLCNLVLIADKYWVLKLIS